MPLGQGFGPVVFSNPVVGALNAWLKRSSPSVVAFHFGLTSVGI